MAAPISKPTVFSRRAISGDALGTGADVYLEKRYVQRRPFSAAAAVLLLSSAVAEAKIECRDGFQIVNGQQISTPYCNDGLVGSVAREHGMKISDETVRNNPSAKG